MRTGVVTLYRGVRVFMRKCIEDAKSLFSFFFGGKEAKVGGTHLFQKGMFPPLHEKRERESRESGQSDISLQEVLYSPNSFSPKVTSTRTTTKRKWKRKEGQGGDGEGVREEEDNISSAVDDALKMESRRGIEGRDETFVSKLEESSRIKEKFPGRVPIIVNPHKKTDPHIDKKKYLSPTDISVSQFQYVIRNRLSLPSQTAFFLFLDDNTIPAPSSTILQVYQSNCSRDGFLYLTYTLENAFGLEG